MAGWKSLVRAGKALLSGGKEAAEASRVGVHALGAAEHGVASGGKAIGSLAGKSVKEQIDIYQDTWYQYTRTFQAGEKAPTFKEWLKAQEGVDKAVLDAVEGTAKQGTKGAAVAVPDAARAAEKGTEQAGHAAAEAAEAVEETAAAGARVTEEAAEAAKGVSKASRAAAIYGGVRTVAKDAGKGVQFLGKSWPGLLVGYVGYQVLGKDKSVLDVGLDTVVGNGTSKEVHRRGLAGGVNYMLTGEEGADKSLAGGLTDTVFGDGTYQGGIDAGGRALRAIGSGAEQIGDGLRGIYDRASGAGQQDYPAMRDPYAQQLAYPQQGYQSGSAEFPFATFTQAMNSMLGGGKAMSLAALIPAAYLLFGRFGWFAKLGGLMLSTFALKNYKQHGNDIYRQQPGYDAGRSPMTSTQPVPAVMSTAGQTFEQLTQRERQQEELNNPTIIQRSRV